MLGQAGAYGIVVDESGRLLVLLAGSGRHYLPGGRIEPGESAGEALAREIGEECGWRADVQDRLTSARQLILDGAVYLDASYWRARLLTPLGMPGEHQLLWLSPAEALAKLHREGDHHAVRFAFG